MPSSFAEFIRRLRPDIVFGADLIAGFPTEDEAMFSNTLRLVDECGLSFLHVFPFSARPRQAARMPQLDRALVKERAAFAPQSGGAPEPPFAGTARQSFPGADGAYGMGRTPGFTKSKSAAKVWGQAANCESAGHQLRRAPPYRRAPAVSDTPKRSMFGRVLGGKAKRRRIR